MVELNIVHDGTNVELLEYGRLTTGGFAESSELTGLGTYHPYIDGSNLKVDFVPNCWNCHNRCCQYNDCWTCNCYFYWYLNYITAESLTLKAQTNFY